MPSLLIPVHVISSTVIHVPCNTITCRERIPERGWLGGLEGGMERCLEGGWDGVLAGVLEGGWEVGVEGG